MNRRRGIIYSQNGGGVIFYDKLLCDGLAYIDTGISPTDKDDIKELYVAGGRSELYNDGTYFYLGSAYNTVGNNAKSCIAGGNINIYGRINMSTNRSMSLLPSRRPYDFSLDIKYISSNTDHFTLIVDGDTTIDDDYTKTRVYGGNYSFYIFAINQAGSPSGRNRYMYIRKVIIDTISNGKVELFPCTLNGEAGLYDKANEKFYGNANTEGQLTAAND